MRGHSEHVHHHMVHEKVEGEKPVKHKLTEHHQMMIREYRKRLIVSTLLTIPILIFSPSVQEFLKLSIIFPYQQYLLFIMSSIVYGYGGWPFLRGLAEELKSRTPGMKVLIGVAISTAYLYSALVIFGLSGKPFFWELATLIDIMLLGHWIEMRWLPVHGIFGILGNLHGLPLLGSDSHPRIGEAIRTPPTTKAPHLQTTHNHVNDNHQ